MLDLRTPRDRAFVRDNAVVCKLHDCPSVIPFAVQRHSFTSSVVVHDSTVLLWPRDRDCCRGIAIAMASRVLQSWVGYPHLRDLQADQKPLCTFAILGIFRHRRHPASQDQKVIQECSKSGTSIPKERLILRYLIK